MKTGLRKRFAIILKKRRRLQDSTFDSKLHNEYEQELIEEARKRGKEANSIHSAWVCLSPKIKIPIYDKYKELIEEEAAEIRKKIERYEARLRKIAKRLKIQSGEKRYLIKVVFDSTYHTQGFGMVKYAESNAELYASKARYYKVQNVKVKRKDNRFEVSACFKSVLDKRIFEYKPDIPIKEWIAECWKRGVNPRVYIPYLPADLEEKLGLDYYGNNVEKSEDSFVDQLYTLDVNNLIERYADELVKERK